MPTYSSSNFRAIVLLMGALIILGCQQPEEHPGLLNSIEFRGEQRDYSVFLPDNFDSEKTYWLLVRLYGPPGLSQEASRQGLDAIVLAPSGMKTNFSGTGNGDYLKQVIRDAQTKYQLHDKILITGHSSGGGIAHRFALQNPDWIEAAAPYSSGSWTTPDGRYLMTGRRGETPIELPHEEVEAFLTTHERENQRLGAKFAGLKAQPGAVDVPFLIMCGTLDRRLGFAQRFAQILKEHDFRVETEWPETDHRIGKSPNSKEESDRYNIRIINFFLEPV